MRKKDVPLKTLFVLPGLEAGGAERVLISLMNGINREKFDPVFLSVNKDGPLRYLIDPSISVHTLNQKLTPQSLPVFFKKVKEIKPDIIISTMAHMNFVVLPLKMFFPDTLFMVREAITPSYFFKKFKGLKRFVIKSLYKGLYPKADFILSPTQKIFDEFQEYLNMNKRNFVLIKNPVNIKKIRESVELPEISEERKETVHFVACGRLVKQKGYDRLIAALDKFKTSYDWKLNILGEGPERSVLEALIKEKGLQDKVFLKGLIIPPYSYVAESDCFLMPSRFEGLPNAVLEALACGTPVIATQESGGIDEIEKDSPEGCVKVVQNMEEFITEMEKVKPVAKNSPASPLLAKCYHQETVFDHFEELLDSLSPG